MLWRGLMPDLFQSLSEGLYIMLARNLDFSPAASDLPFTIQVVYADLSAHGLTDDDCGRVEHALNMIGRTCQRWPTTKTIIDSLPPKYHESHLMLEKTETEEQRQVRRNKQAENLRLIKEMAQAMASVPIEKRQKPEPEYNEAELIAGRQVI